MSKSKTEEVLNECINLLIAGNSVEQCLEKYPDADESLLKTAEFAIRKGRKNPSQKFQSELREKLLKKMREMT